MQEYDIKVSVIIPTYNREAFVSQAIESVVNQNWEVVGDDWELIVVDDGSEGLTGDIINSYVEEYSDNVHYVRHEKNQGISWALNSGFKMANGKYICWLSDDDKWFPFKIKIQYPLMEENLDIPLSYSDYTAKDLRHNTIKYCKVFPFVDRESAFKRLFNDCFINGSTIMLRREVFDKIGYFSEEEENRWNQDLEFWFRILLNYEKILHIPQTLITRTNHKDMLSIKYCAVGNEVLFPKVRHMALERGINIL